MPTYIISIKQYSPKALRLYRYPYVWKHVTKWRGTLPRGKIAFHSWLYQILASHGYPQGGEVMIYRPQAEGESAGFKLVFMGECYPDSISVTRIHENSGDLHKPIPNASWSRQPWYVRKQDRFFKFRKNKGRGRF